MDRDLTIIKTPKEYFISVRNIFKLSAVSTFPVLALHPYSTSLFDSFLLLFNSFFIYPYVLMHEFGHILFFFFFYPSTLRIMLKNLFESK